MKSIDLEFCNQVIEGIFLEEKEKLEMLIRSLFLRKDMKQLELIQLIDVIAADSRLAKNSFGQNLWEVKTALYEAVTNSVTRQGLELELVLILHNLGRKETGMGKRENRQIADEMEEFLIANYSKSISSELLSKKFGFVPSYLSKVFRSAKGMSPPEYLTRYRLERAKKLIEEHANIKICDVANVIGYDDPYYFSKTFKKHLGMWPKAYQDQVHNKQ